MRFIDWMMRLAEAPWKDCFTLRSRIARLACLLISVPWYVLISVLVMALATPLLIADIVIDVWNGSNK